MSERRRPAARAQRGLSIVELMVAMVIALIISLAAAGSARTFSVSQRQGVGSGTTVVSATAALAALKDEAARAGLGFFGTRDSNGNSRFSCHTMSLSLGTTRHRNSADFAPVRITTDATGNQRLEVVTATSIDGGADVLLTGTANAASARTQSRLPAAVGAAVMLVPATPGSHPCLVRSVTAVADATDDTPQTLTFGAAGLHNQTTFATTPSFADADRITLLGELSWASFELDGTNLLVRRPLTGTSATLLRNVVAFRVQYGVAASETSNDLAWQGPTGSWSDVTGTEIDRIRALRVGVVTRSPQRERPDASGQCTASDAKPTDPFDATVVVEPDVADWRCYRYRSATVIVPLRNLVW